MAAITVCASDACSMQQLASAYPILQSYPGSPTPTLLLAQYKGTSQSFRCALARAVRPVPCDVHIIISAPHVLKLCYIYNVHYLSTDSSTSNAVQAYMGRLAVTHLLEPRVVDCPGLCLVGFAKLVAWLQQQLPANPAAACQCPTRCVMVNAI